MIKNQVANMSVIPIASIQLIPSEHAIVKLCREGVGKAGVDKG